jgi:hypothetical protein
VRVVADFDFQCVLVFSLLSFPRVKLARISPRAFFGATSFISPLGWLSETLSSLAHVLHQLRLLVPPARPAGQLGAIGTFALTGKNHKTRSPAALTK